MFMFVWTRTDSEEHDSLPRSYFKRGVVLLHFQLVQIQKCNSCCPSHDLITVKFGVQQLLMRSHPRFLWKCVRRSSQSQQEVLKSFIAGKTAGSTVTLQDIGTGVCEHVRECVNVFVQPAFSDSEKWEMPVRWWRPGSGLRRLHIANKDNRFHCKSQICDQWSIFSLFSDILFVT